MEATALHEAWRCNAAAVRGTKGPTAGKQTPWSGAVNPLSLLEALADATQGPSRAAGGRVRVVRLVSPPFNTPLEVRARTD